ncbi:START domain-containing protein [Thalassolituus marinus]|uniref:START domain-containing protein n=1 Tax=Thalassolituus marinus TaxID=671053 RepID=A0ABS7ZM41_9GAMM|nr:START domain-containing protein [Thalassolituus marinus]MCA6062752.1 START domain-containing protein [Thalassolituus marinus]
MRLLFVLSLLLLPVFQSVAADWELVKEDKRRAIQVFLRDVPGSELREFRGEMTLRARIPSLVALVEDTSQAPNWLHQCKALELIEAYSPQRKLLYMVSDAPWPVTDRDSIFLSELSQDEQGNVVINMTARPDGFPANDDYIRIPRMNGRWTFAVQEGDMVKVTYQVHAEPGGGLPSWLINSVVVDNPYYTLRNMARMVNEEPYRDIQLSHVHDAVH